MTKEVVIIGAGFSGMASAAVLAQKGFKVKVLEKLDQAGGRARKFSAEGFTYDMGPSWYWMPEVFEDFFQRFGKTASDYYQLKRLDPSYRVFYGKDDFKDIPAGSEQVMKLFETMEKGAGQKLKKFLKDAAYKYRIGVGELVHKPGKSVMEFARLDILKSMFKMQLFSSFYAYVRKNFKNPRLHPILYFPIIFLGATPKRTPALYSLMNYADMELGTWYPMGGMYEVVEGFKKLAESLGVEFIFNAEVTKINIENSQVKSVVAGGKEYKTDVLLASADYQFVEQQLLPKEFRRYSPNYWDKREMSPSSLIFYLGIDKKLDNFQHHTLLFDEEFEPHAQAMFEKPEWPEKPLLYTSVTSKTDPTVAPEGKENLMVLIPVAPGLKDTEETREKYYKLVIQRLEQVTGQEIGKHVIYKRSYAHNDFVNDYHAYKGNAYGLGNTLRQTAFLKPGIVNKKLPNLFYTGQLTTPGPGVPPVIISGQVVANEIIKQF
ncbi:phytoene desaturase family protein [Bacteroidota bacterium]